jgi:hypothetical protein
MRLKMFVTSNKSTYSTRSNSQSWEGSLQCSELGMLPRFFCLQVRAKCQGLNLQLQSIDMSSVVTAPSDMNLFSREASQKYNLM